MRARYTTLLALLVLLLAAAPGQAKAREVKIDGTVLAASQSNILVQAKWGQAQVFLTSDTRLKHNRYPRPGDRVQVRGWRTGDGRIVASRVDVKGRSGGYDNGGGGYDNGGSTGSVQVFPRSGEVVTITRPPIGANFTVPVQVQSLVVDGQQVPVQVSFDGRQVQWVPQYDLQGGRHNVSLQAVEVNTGRQVSRNWWFTIGASNGGGYNGGGYPGYGQLSITNLGNGQTVPGNFNVQGYAQPNSRIVVNGQYDRALIPGVISLPGGTIRNEGYVQPNGRFDVPISMGDLPNGSRVDLTVTAVDAYGRQTGSTNVWVRVQR